jgi:AAHS family cis,cis-muconate transporter-like MFS transporter
MTAKSTMDRTGVKVALAVFVGLVADGTDLQMLSLALPQLTKELHLSNVMAGALGTYTLLGMAGGGFLGGWAADRLGRVRVTFWAIVSFTITTVALAFTRGYVEFAIIRFFSGLGLGCLYSIGNVLAAEYVPSKIRTTVLGMLQAGWSVGYVVAALLSTYVLPNFGWRPLFACAVFPGVLCVLLLRGVKDPESWHAARQAALASGKKQNEYRKIWEDPAARAMFMLWCATSIALQFGYYGANTWLPSYLVKDLGVNLKNMAWYMAATYTCMILGKVAAGWLSDRFGRRLVWTLTGIASAAALPLIMWLATPVSVAYLLLLFGLLYGAPYAILATYMSESFPTSVRATGMATAYAIGRAGATISPLMIGWAATHYSITAGIAMLGISYAICGLIPGLFIREKLYDPKAVGATAELAASPESAAQPRASAQGR